MIRFVLLTTVTFILGAGAVYAAPEMVPETELLRIFAACERNGFLSCEREFHGTNRGVFHLMIQAEKLRVAEQKLESFIDTHYNEDRAFFESQLLQANVSLSLESTLYLDKMAEAVKQVTQDGDMVVVTLHSDDVLVLIPEEGAWKLAIPNSEETKFQKTEFYRFYLMMRLKTNILRFHIAEARVKKMSRDEFLHRVNEALAPLVMQLVTEEERPAIAKWLVRDIQDVADMYLPLETDEAIKRRLGEGA